MSKVVFLSNVDRRFAMMQVALQQLQQENLLSNDSVCAKLSDNTVWNDEWQKLLEDADILLLKWMGAGLDRQRKFDFTGKTASFERQRGYETEN